MSILDVAAPEGAPGPTNIFEAADSGADLARAKLQTAADANPDQSAKAMQIGEDLGVPPNIVDQDFKNFENIHSVGANAALVNGNQFLQTYLNSHPMAARVSKDDLPQLDAVSKSMLKYSGIGIMQSTLGAAVDTFKEAFNYPGQQAEFQQYQQWLAQNPLFANVFIRRAAEAGGSAAMLGVSALNALVAGGAAATGELYKRMGGNEAQGNRLVRDIIAGIQVTAPEVIPEAQSLAAIEAFHNQIEPFISAKEPPPVGFHPITDKLHEEEAKIDQDNFGDAMEASAAAQTRGRSPELFEGFLRQHTDGTIGIKADAIRELYGDKVPQPDDGILGWVPRIQEQLSAAETTGGDVEVPVATFLARAEPQVWNKIKDAVRFREGGVTVGEAKEATPVQPAVDTLDGLRQASGLKTPVQLELPIEGTTRMEDRQPFAKPTQQEQKYFKLIDQQKEEDRAWLQQHFEDAERRLQNKSFKERTAELRPQVEEEIRSQPGHALDAAIRETGLKLSREGLTDEQISSLPKSYVAVDGIHPDDLAGVFGHQSGRDLVGDLINHLREREASGLQPKEFFNKQVKDTLRQRVEGELGPTAEERLAEIKDRVLSETTEDLLHEDTLRAATEAGQQYPINKDVLKAAIRQNYRRLAIGDVSSDRFLADAGRAGRAVEASLLKGDAAEAFRQRQRREWAFMYAREARKTEKAMASFDRTAKQFSAREVGSVDQDYTNFVHDILLRVGKPVKRSIQDLAQTIENSGYKSLADFVDHKQGHDLREVPVADFLMDPGFRKAFDNLTVEEFEAVHGSIKTLIKNGRDERKIIREGVEHDLAEIKGKMLDQIQQFGEKKYTAEGKREQFAPGVRKLLRTAFVSHLQVENVLNRMDRFDPNGVFSQFVYRDLASAANHEAKLLREYSTKLGAIADTANLKELVPNNLFMHPFSRSKEFPHGNEPMVMTRKNLRAVLLNVGNESNLTKLARGYGVDPTLVKLWLNHNATKADWDWAQKVWDLFEELHQQSNVMYRNLAGVEPEALVVNPIQNQHGTYRGGYYPLIRHPTFGEDVKLPKGGLEEEGYVRATTPAGYTKARTGAMYPLALDLDALPNRLRQIIHDISFRPSVIQAGKIFYDKRINSEIIKHLGKEYADMFIPWLRDVANVQNFTSSAEKDFGYWSDFMRQNAVTTLVGFNPGTALKHTPTALISSMAEVGPANFLKSMRSLMSVNEATGESNWKFAMGTSEELQRRSRNWLETMGGGMAQLEGRTVGKALAQREYGAAFMSMREALTELSSKPVAMGDLLSAVPTWLAQYEKSMGEHGVHGDAVAEADRAVRRAHGSSAITSRSQVARSRSALAHWMTGFFTFFNDIFNRQVETLWRAGNALDLAKDGQKAQAMVEAKQVAGRLFAYVVAPAMIEELVSPLTNKDRESWSEIAAKSLLFTLSSSWIGVRDIVSAILNKRDPSVGLLSTSEKSISDMVRDVTAKRMNPGNVVRHGAQLGGMLTGLTPAPIGRAAEFAINRRQEHPRGPWGWAVGLRFGTLKGHSQSFDRWMRGQR